MEMELKTISLDKIQANKSQPRERFDEDKIKELAESILSNGQINPIIVREGGDKYIIVAGERRVKAHKIAGLKNIQAFIKKYKDDSSWMVESLIENVQREDLSPLEKAKYLKKIQNSKGIKTIKELAKLTKISDSTISDLFEVYDMKDEVKRLGLSQTQVIETRGMHPEDRKKILEKASKEDLGNRRLREVVKVIKKAPEDVKKAYLRDEIDIKQAEKISQFESPKARTNAIKDTKRFRKLSDLPSKLNKNSKPEVSDAVKKKFENIQKKIFEYLNDAKGNLGKANNSLKEANMLMVGLMSQSFEYGLPKKTLTLTLQQLKSISEKINEFDLASKKFAELKDTFADRTVDALEGGI